MTHDVAAAAQLEVHAIGTEGAEASGVGHAGDVEGVLIATGEGKGAITHPKRVLGDTALDHLGLDVLPEGEEVLLRFGDADEAAVNIEVHGANETDTEGR